jgi:hypothetical protein
MFRTIAELVPPPPGGQPPILWGTEEHIRELLGEREGELDEAFRAFLAAENLNDDGTLRFNGEYLLAVLAR